MARTLNRIVRILALLALIVGTAQPLDAQRGRGGGGGRGAAHARGGGGGGHRGGSVNRGGAGRQTASRSRSNYSRQHATANRGSRRSTGQATANRGGNRNARTNRTANAGRNRTSNRSTNVNRNRNVNRTVNRNTYVNRNLAVSRNWNGNYWGGARVRAGYYAWPRGYGYVRRSVGWVMPPPFLTAAYFYTGWAALGLVAPSAGYRWIRYGPDLLLVDIATGDVVDVRYGVFG